MSFLKKLLSKNNKPYFGFNKLNKGYHEIVKFRVVSNKYAKKGDACKKSILIELEKEVLFLPSYFRAKFSDVEIEEFNSCIAQKERVTSISEVECKTARK